MTLMWAADLTQADVVAAGFVDANYNRQTPAGDGDASGLPWPMLVAAAPDGVRSTECTLPSGGHRDEIVPNVAEFTGGENYYFTQQFYLPTGFDTTANAGSQFQVIEQMRQDDPTGSPCMAIEVRNGGLLLTGAYGVTGASPANEWQYSQTLVTTITTGVRHTIIYRLGPFSTSPGGSTVDFWVDGTQVLSGFTIPPPTIFTDATDGSGTARKTGWYRDAANTYAGTIWQSGHAQGTTFADVAGTTAVTWPPSTLRNQQSAAFYGAMQ